MCGNATILAEIYLNFEFGLPHRLLFTKNDEHLDEALHSGLEVLSLTIRSHEGYSRGLLNLGNRLHTGNGKIHHLGDVNEVMSLLHKLAAYRYRGTLAHSLKVRTLYGKFRGTKDINDADNAVVTCQQA